MTTKITVTPHGHQIEVVIAVGAPGHRSVETTRPDPHGTHDYYVYDDREVTIREFGGFVEKVA